MSTFTREDLASLSNQENVVIPEGYERLELALFIWNTTIKSVTFPDSLREIASDCFRDCTNLEHVRLGADTTQIGSSAFYGCIGLKDVSFLETIDYIGSRAFEDCTGITKLHLIRGPTKLSERAFSGCTSLESVKLGSNLEVMAVKVFEGCTSLKKVEFGAAVPFEAKTALCFKRCPNLKTLTLGPQSLHVRAALFYGSSIRAAFFKGDAVGIIASDFEYENSFPGSSRDLRMIVYRDTEGNRETRNHRPGGFWAPVHNDVTHPIHNITEVFPDLWFKGLKSDTGTIRWFKRHPVDAPEWREIPGLKRADLARMLPEGHASFKTARMAASRASGGNALVLRELMKHYSFPELDKVEAFLRDEVGYRPVVSWVSTSTWLG